MFCSRLCKTALPNLGCCNDKLNGHDYRYSIIKIKIEELYNATSSDKDRNSVK